MTPAERVSRDEAARSMSMLALQLAGDLPLTSLTTQMEDLDSALSELIRATWPGRTENEC